MALLSPSSIELVMHWKHKAILQNLVAKLPDTLSLAVYYKLQRRFGGLRSIDPTKRLQAGISIWDKLRAAGGEPVGATFFEVGTGRMVNVPIAYWLMGAAKTITVDLNPYLKPELVRESIQFIANHANRMEALFGDRLDSQRFAQLSDIARSDRFELESCLETMGIEYCSPADASHTQLPPACVDYHTSYTVMEHIPPESLVAICREAGRILKPTGLAMHGIDYSDHFAHSDNSISQVNFLQYDSQQWSQLAGNRFMYMNRLRHSDYLALFEKAGLSVVSEDSLRDDRSFGLIESGKLPLSDSYANRDSQELATTFGWISASVQQQVAAA